MIGDGSLITFSTDLNFKSFFKYPGKFIIQLFTKKKVEHVGIVADGYIYEALYPHGVRKRRIKDRPLYKYSHIRSYPLTIKLTKIVKAELKDDLESQLEKDYSIGRAIYSAFDKIFTFIDVRDKNKKTFCSKLVYKAYNKLGFLPDLNANKINPYELIEACKDHGLIDDWYDYRELIKTKKEKNEK
ncbi:MAG: hypothetical protein HWN81_15010 [Candidatus Lokiarchaeota archaeon]|nr:hypothetical protein [Candidatus Lokiarchaeota archaeon]